MTDLSPEHLREVEYLVRKSGVLANPRTRDDALHTFIVSTLVEDARGFCTGRALFEVFNDPAVLNAATSMIADLRGPAVR
ncbi:hypothetical protein I546_3108 [Mycobacterium kansasii 732]|nr:hypothetical protein I546_3108 [Mycobacterium kansasii 732]